MPPRPSKPWVAGSNPAGGVAGRRVAGRLCSVARSMTVAWLVGGSGAEYASAMVVPLVAVELVLVTVCVVAGVLMGRRSHFWARVLLGCMSWPSLVLLVVLVAPGQVAVAVAWLILMATLVVVPALSCQGPDRLPGPSDEDGSGGSGPDRPPASPEPPHGGLPFADADPSRIRLRDHSSPKISYLKRWRSREPERGPVPTPPNE